MKQQLAHNDYYNTNRLIGIVLEDSKKTALKQQTAILHFFKVFPSRQFTPCEIETYFPEWPITSIRRAMTNLTQNEKLIKTHEMKIGKYGKQCHTWRLA